MNRRTLLLGAPLALALLAAWTAALGTEKSHTLTSISTRKFADSLHSLIAAERQAYAELIVQRLSYDVSRLPVDAAWQRSNSLPVHAQLLRLTAGRIQKQGAEFSFVLRSLWPINPNQSPQTEIEEKGLGFIAEHPEENFYTQETLGGRSYFTAIYPDRATLPSCIACHNEHPNSPRHDFRTNDVMGAIIVRVPLEF